MMVKSDKCPKEKTSRLGAHCALSPWASGGTQSRMPGNGVNVCGEASGSRSTIRAFPKSAIFALSFESSSTFFAVKSLRIIAGVWL